MTSWPSLKTDLTNAGAKLREPDAYDDTLTKAEASRRIDALKVKLAKERNAGSERPG